MDEFSKWWEQEVEKMRQGDNMKVRYVANKVFTDDAEVIFNAAYSLGLAKGRKEGMEASAKIADEGARVAETAGNQCDENTTGRDRCFARAREAKGIADAIRQAAQGGEGGRVKK